MSLIYQLAVRELVEARNACELAERLLVEYVRAGSAYQPEVEATTLQVRELYARRDALAAKIRAMYQQAYEAQDRNSRARRARDEERRRATDEARQIKAIEAGRAYRRKAEERKQARIAKEREWEARQRARAAKREAEQSAKAKADRERFGLSLSSQPLSEEEREATFAALGFGRTAGSECRDLIVEVESLPVQAVTPSIDVSMYPYRGTFSSIYPSERQRVSQRSRRRYWDMDFATQKGRW
jgi:outer membrane murein-binding lipoprotein Lpp